jgi:hypothetical protein
LLEFIGSWTLDALSKVALRWTQTPFGKLGNRLTWGSGTRGELGGVGPWINMKKVMDGWMDEHGEV